MADWGRRAGRQTGLWTTAGRDFLNKPLHNPPCHAAAYDLGLGLHYAAVVHPRYEKQTLDAMQILVGAM